MIFNWAPTAGIIVDIVMLGFICTTVYLAFRKGLVSVIAKIAAFVLAIILTSMLFKPVSELMLEKTNLRETYASSIQEVLSNTSLAEGELISKEQVNLPDSILNFINDQAKDAISKEQDTVIEKVSDALAVKLVRLIAMLAVFIVIRIALIFAQSILSVFAKLPLINIVDKLGGAAYGFIKAILILYFVLAILSIIATFNTSWNFMYAIEASHIGKYLYDHNIIMNLFSH